MKVLIVGSGTVSNEEILKRRYDWANLVIAADGGTATLLKAGIMPRVVLGDFDSISTNVLNEIKKHKDIEVLSFPVKKDYTDMNIAMNLAVERGASEIAIMGGSGTRLDHTTANIMLLYGLLQKGIKGFIEDDYNRIYLIDKTITLKKQEKRKVSLLPITPSVEGVTTEGLEYILKDASLMFGSTVGVSNEFSQDTALITIKKGLLLVFTSED